jgi:hypothetical protein
VKVLDGRGLLNREGFRNVLMELRQRQQFWHQKEQCRQQRLQLSRIRDSFRVQFLALPQEQPQQQQPQQEQPQQEQLQQQLQQQEEKIQEATWLEEMLNTMQTQLRSLNQPTLQ